MKYTNAYTGNGTDVTYEKENGERDQRVGGSRAWRNNNPGNIRESDFARRNGAIGAAGGFAVFPDYEAGFAALIALLRAPSYQNLNLEQAINRYAPPSENDTDAYINSVEKQIGISRTTPMPKLSEIQLTALAKAIEKHEGYRAGTVRPI